MKVVEQCRTRSEQVPRARGRSRRQTAGTRVVKLLAERFPHVQSVALQLLERDPEFRELGEGYKPAPSRSRGSSGWKATRPCSGSTARFACDSKASCCVTYRNTGPAVVAVSAMRLRTLIVTEAT